MRVWEVDDNRIIPSDLVREQDLIMRIRRLQRIATPQTIINLVLTATDDIQDARGKIDVAQERVRTWAEKNGLYVAEMSNGDIFLIRPTEGAPAGWPESAYLQAWPNKRVDDKQTPYMLVYQLPKDYGALRERLNYYIETSRQAAIGDDEATPAQILQSESVRGPMTTWTVFQIEKLLSQIDVNRYMRKQTICTREKEGKWTPLFEEYSIGFESLRIERFPKLDASISNHLFQTLCHALDQYLLAQLTAHPENIDGQKISMNLSVSTIMDGEFARFTQTIVPANRKNVCFGLHRSDLFQDVAASLNAIEILHQEGFKVAINALTPQALPFLNIHLFNVDYVKVDVAKESLPRLLDSSVQKSLGLVPKDKIIFCRCDTEAALATGVMMGVSKFQGWLVDDHLNVSKKTGQRK